MLTASPSYLRRHAPILQFADLRDHTLLELFPEDQFYQRMLRDIAPGGEWPQLGQTRYCGTVAMVVEAALRGLGLAFLPRWHVRALCKTRQLQPVLPKIVQKNITLGFVMLPSRARAQHLQPLLQYLQSELKRVH